MKFDLSKEKEEKRTSFPVQFLASRLQNLVECLRETVAQGTSVGQVPSHRKANRVLKADQSESGQETLSVEYGVASIRPRSARGELRSLPDAYQETIPDIRETTQTSSRGKLYRLRLPHSVQVDNTQRSTWVGTTRDRLGTKDRPLVSVIIPSYNCARYVRQAVESALAQTYSPVEIIVVDDGSTDETEQVLAPYRSHIRYLRQANRGLPGARNAGIRISQGEVLAFLDADDVWYPEKLELQVELLLADPQVALVHSDLVRRNEETGEYAPSRIARHEFVGHCYERLFQGNGITPSTVIVWKQRVQDVGLFDESLVAGHEDYDLWLRLARHEKFAYVPRPLTIYREHSTNMSRNVFSMHRTFLEVLQKTLRGDPSLWRVAGKQAVRQRLFDLSFNVGYQVFQQGNVSGARGFFWQAAWLRPTHPHIWLLWLSTLLPLPFVAFLRQRKQDLSRAYALCRSFCKGILSSCAQPGGYRVQDAGDPDYHYQPAYASRILTSPSNPTLAEAG
jgi:glycosyltransferase involved in cell wall biosynthesis